MKRSCILIAASVISLSWAALAGHAAWAAAVRVVVQLPQPSGPPTTFGYVCVENGVLPIVPPRRDPRRDTLLLLEPTAGGTTAGGTDDKPAAKPTPGKDVSLRIFGLRFLPEIVAVPAGAQVIFRNDDRLPVTLVSSEAPRLFPTAPLMPGATLAIATPAGLNTLSVRAQEHPQMRATLLSPRGPYRHLKWSPGGEVGVVELDVPPGVYLARVFFAHHYVGSHALTVPADAEQATEIVLRTTAAENPPFPPPSLSPTTDRSPE